MGLKLKISKVGYGDMHFTHVLTGCHVAFDLSLLFNTFYLLQVIQ